MNILDTFFFMFQADVSGVKKGTEEGEASAKKLKKAVDDVDLSADKLAANFVNMAKNAAGALAGVLALGAIKSLVNDTAAHTAAVALQARAIDMNVQSLSAYQAATIAFGGSAEQATQTLAKLRDGFIEVARFGTMGVSPMTIAFQQLGASAQTMREAIKDPTVALSAIADSFAKLDHTKQLFIGQKLGLDQGTIALLAQGKQSFDELIAKERELHAITEEQAQASMKFTIAQKELGLTFEAVKRDIAQELLPAFTWFIQRLDLATQWLREHKAVAIAVFGAIGAVVAVALLPPLLAAAGALWALIAPILAAAAPFIALGVAIGLVVDDIEKYRAGQKSLIGEIMQKWPAAGEIMVGVFHQLKSDLMLLLTTVKSVWDYLAALLEFFATVITRGPSAALDTLNQKTYGIFQNMSKAFGGFASATKEIFHGIGDAWDSLTGKSKGTSAAAAANASTPSPGAESTARLGNSAGGRDIANKLVASGKWTPEQAAGIAGSFMQESRGSATARNPNSGAYGLGQWLGSRVKDFEAWAGHPLKGSSLDEQIAFFNYETDHKERRAGDRIRATKTAAEAADAHARYYERPGAHEINLARREAYANTIYGQSQLAAAGSAPLAQPGATAGVAGSSRTTTVQTGPISVHTQATDANGIAAAVGDALKKHINDAIDQHDNGIAG